MVTNQHTDFSLAIPTIYNGVKLKSRMESQCALLFDRLGWEWMYELRSYMLPNGLQYMPDFTIPGHGVFECRGYDSEKGRTQVSEFGALISHEENECLVPELGQYHGVFWVWGPNVPICYRYCCYQSQGCLLSFCRKCETWRALSEVHPWCDECAHLPEFSRTHRLTIESGKILIDMRTSEEWPL